ncbi:MAG: rane-bound O-acyltransferase family protein [Hymenobacter sp.]|nr:rane-bound O-acyltransferase family protein [Hymenobacter sp.]
MLFNSIQFLVFFLVVTISYFLLPHRFRWFLLLVASCVFYAAFIPIYLLILFGTIIIDYIAGIQIEHATGQKRKYFLILSLVANIGVLAVFKYYNFFTDNVNLLLQQFHITAHGLSYLSIALPIGLSFHTFQAMSYTIEVYRGNVPAERNFGIYALYVMFYPQLVAGPIERPQAILHQFYEEKRFDFERVIVGLERMLWGLFKKAVVSDLLSMYVNSIYNNTHANTGLTLLIATYAFAFQIYCDFSGYSDIALGAAQVMGFKLMENFSLPYFSKSITEFWRRWHISLSSWLRDYLYISLGGNRKGTLKTYRNLMITMLLGGLWHGASWNFVIWGFLNGAYLSIEKMLGINVKSSSNYSWPVKLFRVLVTFHLICLTWVFFRATSFSQAFYVITHIFNPVGFWNLRIQDASIFASMTMGVGLLLVFEYLYLRRHQIADITPVRGWKYPLAFSVVLIMLMVGFGVSGGDQFIYFQF